MDDRSNRRPERARRDHSCFEYTHIRTCASTQLYLIKERIEEEKNRRRTWYGNGKIWRVRGGLGSKMVSGAGNKNRWGKRGGGLSRKRRRGRGGGETRIRGASRFSAGLRASQWLCADLPWVPGTTFKASAAKSPCTGCGPLSMEISPPPDRSYRSGPLFRKEDPLHPFYSVFVTLFRPPDFRSILQRTDTRKEFEWISFSTLNVYFWYMMQRYE